MAALLLLALLIQNGRDSIEELVRDLGHELIEERDRAQRELIRMGSDALPELRKALGSVDGERRARAWSVILRVDRVERERDRDTRDFAELLRLNRPEGSTLWHGRPGTATTETASFNMGIGVREEGAVLYTEYRNFLTRPDGLGSRNGDLLFDLKRVETLDGKALRVERCSNCSPGRVLVKDHKGPVRITVAGTQTWFSRYELEFPAPRNGQAQEVGDMTIEVQWPQVAVRSRKGLPARFLNSKQLRFTYDLKPGASSTKPRQLIWGGGFGCGGVLKAPTGWCECADGAVSTAGPREDIRKFEYLLQAQAAGVALEDVETIRCVIWKPTEIPVEFKVELTPVKAED